MRRIFVDSAYHLPSSTLMTGTNVRAFVSRMGPNVRREAVAYVKRARTFMTYIVHTAALFEAGLDLYVSRLDKSYSPTDCMSMVVCRLEGISEVLTSDGDFAQEGFAMLLPRTLR